MSVHSNPDALEFMDERDNSDTNSVKTAEPWRILIVDDEVDIHRVTVMALAGFRYLNRPLHIVHAYSGAEARRIIDGGEEFAAILLDVVMESDNAGLLLANYIRNELKNSVLRIILRTGHPGTITEYDAEKKYGCNFYEQKTNITVERLVSIVTMALASYCEASALDCDLIDQSMERPQRPVVESASKPKRVNTISGNYNSLPAATGGSKKYERFSLAEVLGLIQTRLALTLAEYNINVKGPSPLLVSGNRREFETALESILRLIVSYPVCQSKRDLDVTLERQQDGEIVIVFSKWVNIDLSSLDDQTLMFLFNRSEHIERLNTPANETQTIKIQLNSVSVTIASEAGMPTRFSLRAGRPGEYGP